MTRRWSARAMTTTTTRARQSQRVADRAMPKEAAVGVVTVAD